MAFKPIVEETTSFPVVPFLSELPKRKQLDGNLYVVSSLYVSDKGVMLFCSAFKLFIFKDDKLHNLLLELVGCHLVADLPGDGIAIQLDQSVKKGCQVGFDDGLAGYWLADGKFYAFTETSPALSESLTLDVPVKAPIERGAKTSR